MCKVELFWSRSDLLTELGCSDRTLLNYCKFLHTHARQQFKYQSGQQLFSQKQVDALRWLAECRRPPRMTDAQIIEQIARNGI